MNKISYDVKDLSLAPEGRKRIEWANTHMPVLRLIKERFGKEKPFKGITIAALLHVTTETANLIYAYAAGGAELVVCAANSHSTQDDVAAALVKYDGISTFAIKGEDRKTYVKHMEQVFARKPQIFIDDGADLIGKYHERFLKSEEGMWEVLGGSEETTTGMLRLRAMEKERILRFPVIGVNDSQTKHLFDNRYGTGQSTMDAVLRATDLLMAGKTIVVCGYGWCGRGIATRAKGMGAHVIVAEVDPVKALEAVMDGFQVMPVDDAVKVGDVVITATGSVNVIGIKQIEECKDGAILANAGHFYVEFDYYGLVKMAIKRRKVREFVEEFTLKGGRKLYVLGEGRLVNLAVAHGHPPDVMDMSFANQALAAEYIMKQRGRLENKMYLIPEDLDKMIASLKLQAMGIKIDKETAEQKKYLSMWSR